MDTADRVLYHQIHPVKLGTDLVAELVSLPLLWRRRYRTGLAVHFLPPIVASAVVTRWTNDLERIRDSPAGRYVRTEMTPAMQAVRLAGDGLTIVGAWRRRPGLVALGALVVIAGWTIGPRAAPSARPGSRRLMNLPMRDRPGPDRR